MIKSFAWRNRWSLLRWSLVALVLVGLGWVLHAWLPPEPRWVVRASLDPLGLAPDGKSIRTRTGATGRSFFRVNGKRKILMLNFWNVESHGGPVQFWDVETGREVWCFVDKVSSVDSVAFSSDGRRLYAAAWQTGENRVAHLYHADLDTGKESHAAIETDSPNWNVHLSSGGKLLLLESTHRGPFWQFNAIRDRDVEPPPEPEPRPILIYDAQSLRLLSRVDGRGWDWQWAPDGEALLLFAAHDTGKATLRRITAQGETITLFDGAGQWRGVTPDGRTLLTDGPVIADGDESGPSVLLWDTVTGRRQGEIPRFLRDKSLDINSAFLANGRALVIAQEGSLGQSMAVVWDLDAHARLGEVPMKGRFVVSTKLNVFALFLSGASQLALYRSRPFARLWQRDLPGVPCRHVEFLADTNRMVAETGGESEQRLAVLDVETGQICFEIEVLDQHRLIPRGRYLAVEETVPIVDAPSNLFKEIVDKCFAMVLRNLPARAEFSTFTRVFDTQTGEQVGRLELRGASLVDLTPDGRSIILQEADIDGRVGSLSCYDVPARAYWAWIIGIPLAVALLIVGLRTGWRWVRRRRGRASLKPLRPAEPSSTTDNTDCTDKNSE